MTEDKALDLAQEALKLSSVTVDSFGVQRKIQEAITAITAIKQARALDKKAENARELGLDYEPAEVLGHNGWGFPIKAAAPVREDWGPGPHECHSLTAAPVQEPVAECVWEHEDNDYMPGTWKSGCGVFWTFTDGSPVENDMKYCCGCGAKLKELNT